MLAGLFLFLGLIVTVARCRAEDPRAVRQRVRTLAAYPHDRTAYTQGLLWHDGSLYESTGRYGESRLREVELASGRVLRERRIPDSIFAEGLERVEDRLVQLSYQAGRAFVYRLADFEPLTEFAYEGEGWGLCYDGGGLWMSDGSDRLTVRDPKTFATLGDLRVTLDGRPLERLNELECAEGWIFANVYGTERIVRIDPRSGEVRAVIDASDLLTAPEREGVDVLNGIAYDPSREAFFITGKYWPKLFEVVFE